MTPREALQLIHDKVNSLDEECGVDPVEIRDIAREALKQPILNYEVGTAEEQAKRFILFCLQNSFRGVCNGSCRFANVNRRLGWQEIGQARCFPFWAKMPYEEGGAR